MIIPKVFLKRFWREFWFWSFSSTKTILKTKKKVLPSISIIIARKSTIDNLIMVVTLSWSMFLWDEFKPELIRNSEFTERRTVAYRVMKISHCHIMWFFTTWPSYWRLCGTLSSNCFFNIILNCFSLLLRFSNWTEINY